MAIFLLAVAVDADLLSIYYYYQPSMFASYNPLFIPYIILAQIELFVNNLAVVNVLILTYSYYYVLIDSM
jgi:hypothetical protein